MPRQSTMVRKQDIEALGEHNSTIQLACHTSFVRRSPGRPLSRPKNGQVLKVCSTQAINIQEEISSRNLLHLFVGFSDPWRSPALLAPERRY